MWYIFILLAGIISLDALLIACGSDLNP